MRTAKKIIAIMRTVGVVFLCFAVLFSIYSLANTVGPRKVMMSELENRGVQTSFMDGLSYDISMFRALSYASFHNKGSVNVRLNELKKYFNVFAAKIEAASENADAKTYEAAVKQLNTGFDVQNFLTRYESSEKSKEDSLVTELCDALDALSVPVSKAGKVLPKGKKTTCRPTLEAAYEAQKGSGDEDIGTLYEYVSVVSELMNQSGAKDVSAFIADLSKDTYLQALEISRSENIAEREEPSDIVYEQLSAGAFDAEQMISALSESYTKAGYTELKPGIFAKAVCSLLIDNERTDFTYSDITAAGKTIAEEEAFDTYLTTMCTSLIETASLREVIPGIGIFYFIVSCTLHMWILSLLLLTISAVWDRLLTSRIVRITAAGTAEGTDKNEPLLRVEHLKQYFGKGGNVTRAVDDVSFYIKKGEVFGLVGESGCGKTTTGRTIINLYDPTAGDVYLNGLRISTTKGGLSVYRSSERAKYHTQLRALRYETKAAIKADSSKRQAFMKIFREKRAVLCRELNERLDAAQIHAIESSAEKSRCTARFREERKAQLTQIYEREIKSLAGEEAQRRTRLYRHDLRNAEKESVMTRMQMIFQDPIASIDPRMTVREIISEGLIIRGMHDKAEINKRVDEMLELVGLVPEHADRYPHEFSGGQRQRIGIARAVIMEPDLIIADEPVSALDVSIQAQVLNLMNDLRERMGLTILFIAHNLSVVKYFSDRIGVMYYGKLVEVAESEELFAHPMHPYTRALLSAIPYPDPYYEKHRTRIIYKPEPVPEGETEQLREIRQGHFVQCTKIDFERLRKECGDA